MHSKLIPSLIAACLLLLLLFFASGDNKDDIVDNAVLIVSAQTASASISERGVLVSDDIASIRAGASGVIVQMEEGGSYVKKGQHVLTMDSSEPESWYEDALDRIATLRNDKQRAERELSVVQVEERNRELVNVENLKLVKLDLELTEAGAASSSRRLMAIDIELAQIDLAEAREELDREQRLYEKGLSSALDIEKARRQLVAREAQMEELLIEQRLLLAGPEPEIIEEMKTRVQMQEFIVKKNKNVSQARMKRIRNNIQTIEERIAVERQDLTISGAQVKGAIAYASRDGLLINKGFKDWRNAGRWVPNTVGTKRYIGDVIYEVIDPSDVKIDLTINEVDYGLVEEGQNVTITIPALKNRRFSGVLSNLGGMGRDRRDASITGDDLGKTDVTVYSATVHFDETVTDFRPGMSAIVTFPTMQARSTIIIPRTYTRQNEDGSYSVRKVIDGQAVDTTITGMPRDIYYFKVSSGLQDGDRLQPWGIND